MALNEDGKLSFAPTYSHWLEDHTNELDRYLYECIEEYSRDFVKQQFLEFPQLGKTVVEDFVTNSDSPNHNINRLLEYIHEPGVFVILLLGMPDSGKTTTAYAICNRLKEEYNIVHVAPLIDEDTLPDWIHWKSNPYRLENGDLAIVDEASIQNNARRASSKKNMDDLGWLAVGRHVGAKMIYITQMSSIADVNLTRWANIIISKGYGSSAAGATEIERKHIADNPVFQYLKPLNYYAGIPSNKKDWAVVTAKGTTYMTYLPKPAFMNDRLSRSYMRYIERANGNEKAAEAMAMHDAEIMRANDHNAQTIYTQMMARGIYRSKQFWKDFTGENKKKKDDEYE